ncbi:hypothetical protein LQE92_06485 [Lacrimispora sp. NSJ-141]|uniref:Uncharacterized protein n=1 Tax=Lientehia hominis TaxID=2897778 RepID=A0AAP2RHW0_9FIRM|nr:hypothetical protein [Lientehia hominis]MCD2492277.1 hypothetical protein [Lientehia hominis]
MKVSKKTFLVNVIFICFVFQQALQYCPIREIAYCFQYVDEIITLLFLLIIFYNYKKLSNLIRIEKRIIITFGIILLIGIISTFFYQYQSWLISFQDAFICSKFLIVYIAIRTCFQKYTAEDICKRILKTTKFIVIIFFVLSINDAFFKPIFHTMGHRLFARSIMLLYPHPTYLASVAYIMLLILAIINSSNKKIFKYMIMDSCIIILTFRYKAVAAVVIFWMLYFYILKIKAKSKLFIGLFSTISCVLIGYEQIEKYFFSVGFSARQVLLDDSIMLALTHWPLGCGFATFGSSLSVTNYSIIYQNLGYGYINGLSKETAAFLNDGFWPIMLGQFGIIAFLLFLYIVYLLFKIVFRHKIDSTYFISELSILGFMLITSLGETSYFSPYAIIYFIFFGLCINKHFK